MLTILLVWLVLHHVDRRNIISSPHTHTFERKNTFLKQFSFTGRDLYSHRGGRLSISNFSLTFFNGKHRGPSCFGQLLQKRTLHSEFKRLKEVSLNWQGQL